MLDQSNELAAWDRDHFFHPSTHMGTHARGEIADPHHGRRRRRHRLGQRRHDAASTPSPASIASMSAMAARRSPTPSPRRRTNLAYYHAYVGHGTEASITLAKMIIDRAPKGMSRVYFGLSGSDANETNIKLDLVLQQCARPAGEEEDHLALARLSRLGRDDRLADRARRSSTTPSTCRARRSCTPRRPITSAAPTAR